MLKPSRNGVTIITSNSKTAERSLGETQRGQRGRRLVKERVIASKPVLTFRQAKMIRLLPFPPRSEAWRRSDMIKLAWCIKGTVNDEIERNWITCTCYQVSFPPRANVTIYEYAEAHSGKSGPINTSSMIRVTTAMERVPHVESQTRRRVV